MYIYRDIHKRIYTYRPRAHICTHMYRYIQIYIYAYTHIQVPSVSWDTPGPMDEVLITVEGRRAVDGAVFANAQAPEWHALAAGLLPRGLEVAITEMSQGASAQVTCVYMYNIIDII